MPWREGHMTPFEALTGPRPLPQLSGIKTTRFVTPISRSIGQFH